MGENDRNYIILSDKKNAHKKHILKMYEVVESTIKDYPKDD